MVRCIKVVARKGGKYVKINRWTWWCKETSWGEIKISRTLDQKSRQWNFKNLKQGGYG